LPLQKPILYIISLNIRTMRFSCDSTIRYLILAKLIFLIEFTSNRFRETNIVNLEQIINEKCKKILVKFHATCGITSILANQKVSKPENHLRRAKQSL